MSAAQEKRKTLVDEKEALRVYLDALLRDVAIPEIESPSETPVAVPQVVAVETVPEKTGTERPAWGEDSFQALLFKVSGLTLAVPLAELSGVQEWSAERVTPMPGHVSWYLGLIQYRERSVPVIDTAQLVMPQDRLERLVPWQERLRHVVFICDGSWALACDELAEVVTLTPDAVRWRSSRTKRRWLAGTVIEQMCALIDPPVFADVLASGMPDAVEGAATEAAGAAKGEQ